MPSKIKVKKATEQADRDSAFTVRHEVFIFEQNCPPDLEREFDDECTHFLATVDGEAAGACRWRQTSSGYKLERFAVLKKYRGFGVGQALVQAVLDELPVDAKYIYLHAQIQAMALYQKFGFEQTGNDFEEAGIRHYKMVKK
jgi:predicted GNAT family N-acyltransferase